MRFLIAIVVLLTSLAGCSSDDPVSEPDSLAPQDIKVEDKRLGAISGVVVDETIRPIASAVLTIRLGDEEEISTTSDESGRFVLEDMEPGLYFITATAELHFEAQQSVEVVAGAVAKPKILLQRDTTPQPYQETFDFNGILRVSDYYGTYMLTVLLGNTDLCECEFYFDLSDTVHSMVVEAFWEANLGDDQHELYFEVEGRESLAGEAQYSTSPMNWMLPRTAVPAEEAEGLVRVSSSVGLDVDQPFELFVTLFHLAPPPASWSVMDP